MKFDLSEIRELITILSKTEVTELELESEGFRLAIRKGPQVAAVSSVAAPQAANAPRVAPSAASQGLLEVKAPMVGTFYRAASPEADPFVQLNDRIRVGQTVCIIEAMKLMNNIDAEVTGRVVEILVENAQPVEFGQVIMRLDPELPI
ncbi:acetyl-CoA carboxylase biotin carboxyl carrier protein [Candidatus Cyanaurora vandensis]|uniref:acetyl-CoA carboxylase biotin carboxyl carrier protein n=1 Tax=Candidatus Cyanaurora vandensis TaxID=2714958 RepID=UPI00257CFEB6|nr:acetyl-CoA carboxylase biotin carboxyl carrier protein [Candidatus Cyanaurora vandensis]